MTLVLENPDSIPSIPPPTGCRVIDVLAFTRAAGHHALVILNQKITVDLPLLWAKADLRVCADGGANQLYAFFEEPARSQFIPQFIVGDCDSLTPTTQAYYEARGTVVVRQATQYATDFQKALSLVSLYYKLGAPAVAAVDADDGLLALAAMHAALPCPPVTLVVVGALGGRLDHTAHSLNQLYKIGGEHPSLCVFFISLADVVFHVPAGLNYVRYDKAIVGPICGLLPFGRQSTLTTKGLKWDVTAWELDLSGGDVSSSNALAALDGIVVECTHAGIVLNIQWKDAYMAERSFEREK